MIGNSKSLIFKNVENKVDVSNTYYSSDEQSWLLSNVSNPNIVSGNEEGLIEFCVENFTPNSKVVGIKSVSIL